MSDPSPANRGPAAAAENRAAILRAARTLFTERGYRVPLSVIAREAGVGQGVMYRHFGSRLELAFAVFEEHFAELEEIAADPGPETFARLWQHLVDLTVDRLAFVELAVDARTERPEYDGEARLRALLSPALVRAQAAGRVPAHLDVHDVVLLQRMLYGIAVTAPDAQEARAGVSQMLGLVGLDTPQRQ